MADLYLAKPFPRGCTGTVSAAEEDIDLGTVMGRAQHAVSVAVPSIVTVIVDTDTAVIFSKAGDTLQADTVGAGDDSVGASVPLKADAVYVLTVNGADTMTIVEDAVTYRVICEY